MQKSGDNEDAVTSESGVFEEIRARLGEFSPAEKRVAIALLDNAETFGLTSSGELARAIGVTAPTVIRFVRRLGHQTYAEFQEVLRGTVSGRIASPAEMYQRYTPSGQGDSGQRLRTYAGELSEAVASTLAGLPARQYEAAIELLADRKRRVYAVGGWFSDLLAQAFIALLQQVRKDTRHIEPDPRTRVGILVDLKGSDVLCVFDYARHEGMTRQLAADAKQRGCKLILFSDVPLSPVAQLADVVLPSRSAVPTAVESIIPAMAVVDALVSGVLERSPEVQARMRQFTETSAHLVEGWTS